MGQDQGSKGQGGAVSPPTKPISVSDWDDVVTHLGQAMVTMEQIRGEQAEIKRLVMQVDGKVDHLTSLIEAQAQRIDRVASRLERPMAFKDEGGAFSATFQGRIGEEVRASVRAEVGGIAQQVYAAVDAHMKQNPIKMPSGSNLVPLMSAVAAVAAGAHLWMSYQAAKNYVPPEVKVNGVRVPATQPSHAPTAQSHGSSMNGTRHPMARAAA